MAEVRQCPFARLAETDDHRWPYARHVQCWLRRREPRGQRRDRKGLRFRRRHLNARFMTPTAEELSEHHPEQRVEQRPTPEKH
jgi:hypothetical protein